LLIRNVQVFREFDVEDDVQVTEVVVAVRRHTLAANDLDSACSRKIS